jgi:cytochrome c biogenesis protein CcdA
VEMPRQSDAVAARYGAGWGLAAAFLGGGAGASAAFLHVHKTDYVALLPCCLFGIFLAWVLSVPGHETARRTGSVGSGTLAGALAGGLGSVGYTLGSDVTLAVLQHDSSRFLAAYIIGGSLGLILNGCIFAGLGAICSLIGAAIGRAGIFAPEARSTPPSPPSQPEGPKM